MFPESFMKKYESRYFPLERNFRWKMALFSIFGDEYLWNRKAWVPENFSEVLECGYAYFQNVSSKNTKVDIFRWKPIFTGKWPFFWLFMDEYLRDREAWGPEIFSEVLEYGSTHFLKVSSKNTKVDIFHWKAIFTRKWAFYNIQWGISQEPQGLET